MNRLLKAAAMTALLMLIAQGIMLMMLAGDMQLLKGTSLDYDTKTILIGLMSGLTVIGSLLFISVFPRKKELTGALVCWIGMMTIQSLVGLVITLASIDLIWGTRWAPHVPQPYNLIGLAVELMMLIALIKLELQTRTRTWVIRV